jgi:hypothetical protein
MEVPPLRLPKLSNVFVKTYTRVRWYLKEILPLFILASVLIWIGQITRLFDLVIDFLKVPVRLIGLPAEAAHIFLLGFFRRDYGAAGLYGLCRVDAIFALHSSVADEREGKRPQDRRRDISVCTGLLVRSSVCCKLPASYNRSGSVKCGFCGHKFIKEQADLSCKGCLIAKGCQLVKCPNCGYETLAEPKWLKKVFRKEQ